MRRQQAVISRASSEAVDNALLHEHQSYEDRTEISDYNICRRNMTLHEAPNVTCRHGQSHRNRVSQRILTIQVLHVARMLGCVAVNNMERK